MSVLEASVDSGDGRATIHLRGYLSGDSAEPGRSSLSRRSTAATIFSTRVGSGVIRCRVLGEEVGLSVWDFVVRDPAGGRSVVDDPDDAPAGRCVFGSEHASDRPAVAGQQHPVAQPAAHRVDGHHRISVGGRASIEWLHQDQALGLERDVLDGGRGTADDATPTHQLLPADAIKDERRCRVNVNGLVTPSPVGVAIVNERYPSPPRPNPAMLGPFLINRVVFIASDTERTAFCLAFGVRNFYTPENCKNLTSGMDFPLTKFQ